MNTTVRDMLKRVSDIDGVPKGAHNIRVNGRRESSANSQGIQIVPMEDGAGIDVHVKAGTKNDFLHIPVVIHESGIREVVRNNFYIGSDCDVKIIAGCGIHNDGVHLTQHDGVHTFYIGENSKVKYVEKHYGEGSGTGERILNPVTVIHLEKGSVFEIETVQINGVDSTKRTTRCDIGDDAKLIVKEKLMTNGSQSATTEFEVNLDGKNSSASISSRSVAKGESQQCFMSVINGNNLCSGHSECEAIIMDNAMVKAVPDVTANHVDASLIHEAAIGKIAGEQIIKLMTLGLSEKDAEAEIISGFLS